MNKQYTLIDKDWRPIAAGSMDAIRAAARLYLGRSDVVLMNPVERQIMDAVNEAAMADLQAQTDAEVFGSLMASAGV